MKSFIALFMFLGLVAAPSKFHAQQVGIKKAEISFVFVSKDVKGTFLGFESASQIDLDNIEASVFEGSVLSETIDTNNGLRNWSLRSGKYFDVDDFPRISFKSTKVMKDGDNIEVQGNLTIKETTKPITISFKRAQNTWVGTTSLYSIDYGIKIKKKREDNLVKVKMVFEIK
ncbi:YceI family protein [Flagellimonas sp. S3867]|uniref:YceI family protein n=1 Tax=Flagellimonas sp. S3867 TaxID=2768063 RepID=UPI001686936F|nr:YceI family protein [Flagellimonas sp. S3867]